MSAHDDSLGGTDWLCACSFAQMLVGIAHFALAYKDPARKTRLTRRQCVVGASNHDEYHSDTVLPPRWVSTFDVRGWVQRYVAALARNPTDLDTLRELQSATRKMDRRESFDLPKRFDQNWFDFIQVKLKIQRLKTQRLIQDS